MRTTERLRKLKEWVDTNLCEGREMKSPAPNQNIGIIHTQRPQVYLAWAPTRTDTVAKVQDLSNIAPAILVMPNTGYAKYMEEQRFDRYNNIHRPSEMGQHLAVSILFCVYEPGIRLPGFIESVGEGGKGLDMSLLLEGTEQGLFTLVDWMDDCMEKLIAQKVIPNTDLWLEETKMTYGLYTDQEYVVDRRPMYYGFVNASFGCYADDGANSSIDDLLN